MLSNLAASENWNQNAPNVENTLWIIRRQEFVPCTTNLETDKTMSKPSKQLPLAVTQNGAYKIPEALHIVQTRQEMSKKHLNNKIGVASMDDQYLDELKKIKKRTEFSGEFIVSLPAIPKR